MNSIEHLSTFDIGSNGTISDYKYSHSGQFLAISDLEGYLYIYRCRQNKMVIESTLKVDDSAILSISWADPKFGYVLGIGTYSNKVLVYQLQAQGWKQIAHNLNNHASINCVEWAQSSLKLYAGSSDGKISILQCQKEWKNYQFTACQQAIISLALQPLALGQTIHQQMSQKYYPRIAVATKNMKIQIFAHQNEQFYENTEQQQDKFKKIGQQRGQSGYYMIHENLVLKQTIKKIIWRPKWGSLSESLQAIDLIYCTQEGFLKNITLFPSDSPLVYDIIQGQTPICHLSQSLTGNLLSVCQQSKNKYQTQIFLETDNEWKLLKTKKI